MKRLWIAQNLMYDGRPNLAIATYMKTAGSTLGRRVMIRDTAKHSGVSSKTASNLLNKTRRMRPRIRKRVEDSIEWLVYTVNVLASSLKKMETKLIVLDIFDFLQTFSFFMTDKVIDTDKNRSYRTIVSTYGSGKLDFQSSRESRLVAGGHLLFADQPLERRGSILKQLFPLSWLVIISHRAMPDLVIMPNSVCSLRHRPAVGWRLPRNCGLWRPLAPG